MPFRKQLSALDVDHDDEGGKPLETPSQTRRRLSNATAPTPITVSSIPETSAATGPSKRSMHKKASALSAFFGKSTVDPEFQKKIKPCYIFALLYFDKPLDIQEVKTCLKDRLGVLPRFRSRISMDTADEAGRKLNPTESVFFDEYAQDELDMDYHVKLNTECKTEDDVVRFLNRIFGGEFLPTTEALWQFQVMNNMDDGRSLLCGTIDHCIADGMTLVECLMSILDDPPSAPEASRVKPRAAPIPVPIDVKVRLFVEGISRFVGSIVAPKMVSDPKTRLTVVPMNASNSKLARSSDTIELKRLKEVQQCFPGSTINDVLCALFAMCLRRFLTDVNDPIIGTGRQIKGSFPMSLHEAGKPLLETFGNKFVVGMFKLALDYTDRVDCVWRSKQNIDAFKNSPEGPISAFFFKKMCSGIDEDKLAEILQAPPPYSAMLSNVCGPQVPVKLLGQTVRDINFYAFPATVGLYFGIFSYAGKVSVSIAVDPQICSDPNDIGKYWKSEFDELYTEVMARKGTMSPPKWPGRVRFACISIACLATWAAASYMGAQALFKVGSHVRHRLDL